MASQPWRSHVGCIANVHSRSPQPPSGVDVITGSSAHEDTNPAIYCDVRMRRGFQKAPIRLRPLGASQAGMGDGCLGCCRKAISTMSASAFSAIAAR